MPAAPCGKGKVCECTQVIAYDLPHDSEVERLPRWLWLHLPIAFAVVLIAWSLLSFGTYDAWALGEDGIIETLHVVLPLSALGLAVWLLTRPPVRQSGWLTLWIGLAALGSFYIAGEEASWGQHFFHWATPEEWRSINDQGETNLHNTSSWLDQKPRTLLEIAIFLGGILIPLALRRWPGLGPRPWSVILPPFIGLPTAIMMEAVRLPERLAEVFADRSGFLFRPSEVQETYIYFYILLYLIVLMRRLKKAS